MNVWKTIYRISWTVLAALLLAGVIFIFGPKFNSLRKMQDDKTDLQEQTRRLRSEMDDLRRKQDRFRSDPDFVERTAKEMGMIRTNEIVFKFDDTVESPHE